MFLLGRVHSIHKSGSLVFQSMGISFCFVNLVQADKVSQKVQGVWYVPSIGFFFPLKIFVKLKYACILINLSAYYSVYMGGRALNIYIYILKMFT